ncbi:MAG: glycosyl hydrolase 53 family protein [Treponema sp.]|nr:glycosyl hydrolase 53 family protein [Treponema sp.]
MKENKKINFVSLVAAGICLLFASCSLPEYADQADDIKAGSNASISLKNYDYSLSAMNVSSDFMRGVDVSEVAALEELGQKWYDSDNTEKDLFEILKNHGVNWVRIRIWNDYTVALNDSWGPYGYNNENRTLSMAKRAKKAGLKIFLDFHYSDNWADPAKQYIPEMWKSFVEKDGVALASGDIDIDGLSEAVADYTRQILELLKSADCGADMVQLGNEMQGGIFSKTRTNASSADGSDGLATNLTLEQRYQILKAAKNAVKSVNEDILVALHCSDPANYLSSFLTSYISNVDPDVVAISYYPYYSGHGTDVELAGFIESIKSNGKKAVVAEVSYSYDKDAWTDDTSNKFYETQESQAASQLTRYSGIKDGKIEASVENQAGVVKYISEIVSGKGASGLFYWGGCYLGIKPGMASSWENQALFDSSGKVLPSIDMFSVGK